MLKNITEGLAIGFVYYLGLTFSLGMLIVFLNLSSNAYKESKAYFGKIKIFFFFQGILGCGLLVGFFLNFNIVDRENFGKVFWSALWFWIFGQRVRGLIYDLLAQKKDTPSPQTPGNDNIL